MIITNSNAKIINSNVVDLHDDILKKLSFERETGTVELLIKKDNFKEQTYTMRFVGVLGFQMTSCDFWGKSPHILDFEYVKHNKEILLRYLQSMTEHEPMNPNCKLNKDENFIETVLTFGSGDKLTVVCEYIVIE